MMDTNEILKEASRRIYEAVKDIAGTEEAGGDFGRGAGGDISRNIDITAENTVLSYLKEINFECVVLGEECGRVELSGKPKGFIIMDAIDGSANAVRGVPFFCSSLAFATENRLSSITDGVITNLSTGQMYSASQGKGAFLEDKQISVHKGTPLYKIVGVNISGASQEIMKKLQPVFENHSHTRHFGANALEMAMFAQGLMDIFIDLRNKIRIQDIAAGYIIVKEAGGLLLDDIFLNRN
jgi:myo-inositol-1(or 4)-monophosphatase